MLLCFCTDHLLCATLSFIPVARKKSSCRHRRFNVIPLKNTTFVSQFTNHVVHLVRSRAERYYHFSDISRYFESIVIAISCY